MTLVEHPWHVGVVPRPGDGIQVPQEMVKSLYVARDRSGGEHRVHLATVVAFENDHAIVMELCRGERRKSLVARALRVGDEPAKSALVRI
jgi:hypothetical protein